MRIDLSTPSPLTFGGPRLSPTSPLTAVGRTFGMRPYRHDITDDISTQHIAPSQDQDIRTLPPRRWDVCIIFKRSTLNRVCRRVMCGLSMRLGVS